MTIFKKSILLFFVIYLIFGNSVMAETDVNLDIIAESSKDGEAVQELDSLTGKLESILDPENNELEQDLNGILEKHSDNWFVKIMNKIINILSSFLDAIFEVASEAAKVGVE